MTPTDRQLRAARAREDLFLDVARAILLERGYLGLTMDRIADATEFSKGTVYLHFANKEEVLAALSERLMASKIELFARARTLAGRPRERCMAIGTASSLWAALYPDDIRLTQIVHSESLREKLSPERRATLERSEDCCLEQILAVVEEAVAAGDLTLPPGGTPGAIAHGLWALHWGAQTLAELDLPVHRLGVDATPALLMRHCQALLDGYGWRPLFAEHDWDATEARIREGLFAAEFARLAERVDPPARR